MSARELAAASGVSPSTVTRIERGEVNPTVAMLEKLLATSGNRLTIFATPRPDRPTLEALRKHREEIEEIVSSFGANNVRVFGSIVRGEATEHSDIDLLIDVPPGTGLVAVEQMTEALESVILWPVDIVTGGAARGRMAHILDEAIAL